MENTHADTPQVQSMPFTDKIVNLFVSPGELFENVRLTGRTNSNWLIPWLLFVVIALITSQVIVSNASLAEQLGATMQKNFEKAVQEGRMTQDQADQVYEQAKPGSMWFTIGQIGGITIGSLVVLFVVSLVFWLIGKSAMSAQAPYLKVVEVIGLTFIIGTLEQLVTTILMYTTDSLYATPSLGIFVQEYDVENKLHVTLSKVNLFTFWDLGIIGVGLSKLFQRDFPKVLVLVAAAWVLWSVVSILTGFRLGV